MLDPGAIVSVRATFFDDAQGPRWSEEKFGDEWLHARIYGTVLSRRSTGITIQFTDGDVQRIPEKEVKLEQPPRTQHGRRNYEAGSSSRNSGGVRSRSRSPTLGSGDPGSLSDSGASERPLNELTPSTSGSPPLSALSGTESEATQSDEEARDLRPEPANRGGRGRGRARGRGVADRGGRGLGRGRGRGRHAARSPSHDLAEVALGESSSEDEESSEDEDGDDEDGFITMANANPAVRWKKDSGRTVDPFVQKGYSRPAHFHLPELESKSELEFFMRMFPTELIPEIALRMTERGRRLGFGSGWIVTPGKVWQFFGYTMAILVFHTDGSKEDLWSKPGDPRFSEMLFLPPDLGKYGLTYNQFCRLNRAFELPTYGDANDPFDPIRRFEKSWNDNMNAALQPGPYLTVDESMALYTGNMPGWMYVHRKPTPCGRESHTTCDCETGCLIFSEMYEGKKRMAEKKFVREFGKNPSKALRCTENWFGSGRLVFLDSGFASWKGVQGFAEHGLYVIGNVKSGHAGFPKKWLKDNAPLRDIRSCVSTSFKTRSGHEWSVIGACDMDKAPMALIGTAGTTLMGKTLERNYTVRKADGLTQPVQVILEQWNIHELYRAHFNTVDKHNAKRQGPQCLEDTWKVHKWWVRDFQMLFGMSEINALLCWRKFKHGQQDTSADTFRRRLAFQMLHHPLYVAEYEASNERHRVGEQHHYLVMNPKKETGQQNRARRFHCIYCHRKTSFSCVCAPVVAGMNKGQIRKAVHLCSSTQDATCLDKHQRGVAPPPKKWKCAHQMPNRRGAGRSFGTAKKRQRTRHADM